MLFFRFKVYSPVKEHLCQMIIFGKIDPQRLQPANLLDHLLPKQTGHASDAVDSQQVGHKVDLGMLGSEIDLRCQPIHL